MVKYIGTHSMRLKSYTAKTTKDAMQMVREELGEDAIIVATHEEKNAVGGRQVRITAAIEKDGLNTGGPIEDYPTDDMPEDMPDENWLYADDGNEAMVIEEITENLLRHTVPDEILEELTSYAAVQGIDEPRLAMLSALENTFRFSPLPKIAHKTPFMMIGPPASGKTLACAKMAARSAMNGLNVAVISTDTERAGGLEQLKAFTDLMDIDLRVAKTPGALKEQLLETKKFDQVIIDTAGTNPFDSVSLKSMAKFTHMIDLEPILILPANMNADEAGETAQIFAQIGAKGLLSTRVDVARRLGSLLTAAYYGNLYFTNISGTARVADGLSQLNPKRLTQLLMPKADKAKINKTRFTSHG